MCTNYYNGRIEAVFQKIHIGTAVWGGEFLCRENKNGILHSPVDILSDVKLNGHQKEFDREMIVCILDVVKKIQSDNMTVNVHPESISDPTFVEWLCKKTKKNNIDARKIILEITEDAPFSSELLVKSNLKALKSFGFRVALDDFGCEYSNLERYIQISPYIDYLKINDKIYTDVDVYDRIVQAISNLIPKNAIIAECIEDEATAAFLSASGVIMQQGYYYHKPEKLGV